MIRQHRAVRRGSVAAALSASLLLGLLGVAPAQAKDPEGPPADLTAITALDSKRSDLRVSPDGSTAGSLGPSAGMGAPADKTLLPADKVLVTKNSTTDAGNDTTRQAVGLNPAMTGLDGDGAPADTPEAVRATIDHQYPSEPGHITNGTTESVLELRESLVGTTDALFQLSTTNSVAETWTAESQKTRPGLGGTYVIQTSSGARVENASASVSGAFGTPVLMNATAPTSDMTTSSDQQWAVIDGEDTDGGQLQFVSRSDGLCLTASGLSAGDAVTTDVCSGSPDQQWEINIEADSSIQIFNGDSYLRLQNGQLVIGDAEDFEFHAIPEPGGAAPTWSVPRSGGFTPGRIAAPYDLAVADLDQVGDVDGQYHDEAFVAYTDSDDNWAIRVVDYNANPSRLLVTAPDPGLVFGKNGDTIDGRWYPGNLITEIGDFDGNGKNEIVVAFQGPDGLFYPSFFGYEATPDGGRKLNLLSSCIGCPGPWFASTPNIGLQTGYVDSAVGDFDGDGRDDLAIGFGNVTVSPYDRNTMVPNLGVVTFKADLGVRSEEVTTPPLTNGVLPPPLADDPARTQNGVQVEAGLFHFDPDQGYGGQRDEIAIAWVAHDTGSAPQGLSGYKLTPQFQLYGVSDASDTCDDDGPGCETATTPLGVDATPSSLFPKQKTTIALAMAGRTYDVPTLSFEGGRYSGIDPDDPPVSGVMASFYQPNYNNLWHSSPQVATSIVVPWVSGDTTGKQWTITDTVESAPACGLPCVNQFISHRFTAYDRLGQSVVLGAPVVLKIEDLLREDLLAAEPPAHADWLNGSFTNVSATPNLYVSTTDSNETSWSAETSTQNTHAEDLSESLKITDTLTTGFGAIGAQVSASVKLASTQSWSGLDTSSDASGASQTVSVQAQTGSDDAVSMSLHDYQVWRYPIIGTAGAVSAADCGTDAPCATYYEVTIPGDTTQLPGVDGTSNELFSPSWQNNNALSYPVLQNHQVPTPDLGPYTSTVNGKPVTINTPIINQQTSVGKNQETVKLEITSTDTGTTSRSSTKGWTAGVDQHSQARLQAGVPVEGEDEIKVEADVGFKASGSLMQAASQSTTATTDDAYTLQVPAVPNGQGYDIGTAYYYDAAGTPKIVHGVDLLGDDTGDFWKDNYEAKPDPALNLPNTMTFIQDAGNSTHTSTYWNMGQSRQLLRGFQTLQVDQTGSVPTAGVPFGSLNPRSGQRMQFQVQVRNLSLADMDSTVSAHFYAVPVDKNDVAVTGSRIDLGESVDPVPAMKGQGSALIASKPWTAPPVTDNQQQYRIFVQINADGDPTSELHPLNGDSCPIGSFPPDYTPPNGWRSGLLDLMATGFLTPDPLGCGQNNQGYGLVTVSPPVSTAVGTIESGAERANVQLAGAGLLTENPGDLQLDEHSPVPTVHAGQQVTGLVHARSERNSGDIQTVVVYDGDPKTGKAVYIGQMRGSSTAAGGHAKFTWTPTTPGLHELHQVIFGTSSAGEDDEQILRVWVDNKPAVQPFTVTASADAPTVDVGKPVTIRGSVTPVPSNPSDRGVQLQVQGKVGWTDVAETDLADDGTYSFTIPETKRGTYSYRVKKFATATSSTGFSPPVAVEVARSFKVSVKASPATVDTGSSVTIKGTVAPKVKAGHRVVDLQVKTGSDWRRVTSKKTKANGSYSFRVKQPTAGTFEYRVEKRAVGSRRTTASPTVTVTVLERYAVTAEAERPKLPKGASTSITGTVTPAGDGPVQLQRRKGSTWRKVATQSTDASGGFSFPVEAVKTGTSTYRVKKTASDGRRAAYSPSVKVKVTKKAG